MSGATRLASAAAKSWVAALLATAAATLLGATRGSRLRQAAAATGPHAGLAALALGTGAYAATLLLATLPTGTPAQAWFLAGGAAVAALAGLLRLRHLGDGDGDVFRAAGPWAAPAVLLGAAAAAALLLRATALGPLLGLAVLVGVGLLVVQRLAGADAALLAVLAAALLGRLALVALDATWDLFPFPDVMGYHYRSAALAEAWWTGQPAEALDNLKTTAYEAAIAPAYVLFGASSLVGRTVNVLFALLATYNVFRIGRHLFGREAGLASAMVFALLPSMLHTHAEHQREALIALLVTEAVFLLVATRFWESRHLALLVACLVPLVFLRRLTLLLFAAPILLLVVGLVLPAAAYAVALVRRGVARGPVPPLAGSGRPGLAALAVALVGIGAFGAAVALVGLPGMLYEEFAAPEALEVARANWSGGGTSFASEVSYGSWLDVALFAPLGAAYFLLSPLPWEIHNAFTLVGVAENLALYYPIVLLALPGLWSARRRLPALAMVAFLAAGLLVYGLVEGNAGTALRHRAQFTWMLFVLAGPALAALHARLQAGAAPHGAPVVSFPETPA